MKSQELIQCFTREEKALLRKYLKAKGASESLPLYDVIMKADIDKKIDKSYLFSFISKEKFTPKKDVKLRHFLRILNEEIEQFIILYSVENLIQKDVTKSIIPCILLLQFLQEKNAFSLFEKEWNKYYKKAQQKKYFKLEKELISLYHEYVTHSQEEKLKYYDKLTQLLKRGIECQQSEYLEELRGLEQKLGFIYYTSMFTGQNIEIPPYQDLVQINEKLLDNDFFKYHQLLAQSFHEKSHEKRIPIFKALLVSHDEVSKIRPELAINERDYNNWLGHCYYFKNEYETSATYFERCIKLMTLNPRWLRLEVVYNYISILTKLERFAAPIPIFEIYKKQIAKNERVRYRFGYIIAICLIFEGRANEAWSLLPKDIHNRPQNDFYYTRFIMVMIYFEENNLELFEREVTNIYQTAHYKTPAEILWLDVSKVFKKMSRIILLPQSEQLEETNKLIEEIELLDGNYPMFKDVLPVKWLMKKLTMNR